MFLLLADHLARFYSFFNVFDYLTLRVILATLTSLALALLFGPWCIRKLTAYHLEQFVRTDGPKTHLVKAGTPTMGGALIMLSIVTTTLLWARLTNAYVWVVLLTIISFAAIGWLDDYLKISRKNSAGLPARYKFLLQSIVGFAVAVYLFKTATIPEQTQLILPFFKNVTINLGGFFVLTSYLVIVGTSNAVNLTDGLDGLAILPTVMVAIALGIFVYLTGNVQFASYLIIPHINGVAELVIICGAITGAGLGFLWFNTYPAQVFMGDVGALGLGAALGVIAVIVRQEIVLFIMGGVFVLEAVSVILQVASFKLTGKRIFKMAPLHHHFELKGWPEPRVIVRFWIITFVLILIGLATLKLR